MDAATPSHNYGRDHGHDRCSCAPKAVPPRPRPVSMHGRDGAPGQGAGQRYGECVVKLIGRTTALVLNYVNPAAEGADLLRVSYPMVNALRYDSIDMLRATQGRGDRGGGREAATTAAQNGSHSAKVT